VLDEPAEDHSAVRFCGGGGVDHDLRLRLIVAGVPRLLRGREVRCQGDECDTDEKHLGVRHVRATFCLWFRWAFAAFLPAGGPSGADTSNRVRMDRG